MREVLLRGSHVARQKLTFRSMKPELEGEIVASRQPSSVDQCRRRRPDSSRAEANAPGLLGALAGHQIERRNFVAFLCDGQEGGRAIEMTDDLEDGLLAPLGCDLRGQESADPEMRRATLLFGNERIRRPPAHGRARIDTSRPNGRSAPDGALPRDRSGAARPTSRELARAWTCRPRSPGRPASFNASWVVRGSRLNLPTMRSTTFSV